MKRFFILFLVVFLAACSVQDNVSLTTEQATCASGTLNAPYCMKITIENNSGGQNYINSTNYPINDLSVTISGAGNILSPMTNVSATDPNGCTSNSIGPGGSCSFFLQISNESYPVGSIEPVNVAINYTINDALFGDSSTSGSNSINVYERTNLYPVNTAASLWVYNNNGLNFESVAESSSMSGYQILSGSIDNYTYGNLFFSNQNAIWAYGNGVVSSTISPSSGITGSNLMFNLSSGLYASASNSGNIWNLPIESGSNTWSTPYIPSTKLNSNTYAVSPSGNLYVAYGSTAQNCTGVISVSSNTGCSNEAQGFPITDSISGMGYAGTLYAGSNNNGLWYESGSGPTGAWVQLSGAGISSSAKINVIKTNGSNTYVIVADNNSNIWKVDQLQNVTLVTQTSSPVTALAIDNSASPTNIYFVVSGVLYSCGSGGINGCTPTQVGTGLTGTMLDLYIGSSLTTD